MYKLERICVFCASHYGGHSRYERAARELGARLAELGIGIVYGGGRVGLMGLLADAALAKGGEVVGVMARENKSSQIAHRELSEMIYVESRGERKDTISRISDGFIALPGGFGVLDELTEMALLTQSGIHRRPCGLLNVNRFFDHLIAHFDLATRDGFIRDAGRRVIQHDGDVDRLLEKMRRWEG
jgi:hypothetical protein